MKNKKQVLQLLKDNVNLEQNQMKKKVDQHHSERIFNVGDWVFLRLQPYNQMSLKNTKKDNKFSAK